MIFPANPILNLFILSTLAAAEFGWVRFVANSKWEAWSCFSIGNTSQSFAWSGPGRSVPAPNNRLVSKPTPKEICGAWTRTLPVDRRPRHRRPPAAHAQQYESGTIRTEAPPWD